MGNITKIRLNGVDYDVGIPTTSVTIEDWYPYLRAAYSELITANVYNINNKIFSMAIDGRILYINKLSSPFPVDLIGYGTAWNYSKRIAGKVYINRASGEDINKLWVDWINGVPEVGDRIVINITAYAVES